MPVTFAQIAAGTASVTIQTAVGPVTIVYYPNKITDKRVAEMQVNNDANTFFTEVISSWDIYEDTDMTVMFPMSRIDELGIPFKLQIMEAVTGNMAPNSSKA